MFSRISTYQVKLGASTSFTSACSPRKVTSGDSPAVLTTAAYLKEEKEEVAKDDNIGHQPDKK